MEKQETPETNSWVYVGKDGLYEVGTVFEAAGGNNPVGDGFYLAERPHTCSMAGCAACGNRLCPIVCMVSG